MGLAPRLVKEAMLMEFDTVSNSSVGDEGPPNDDVIENQVGT